MINSNLNLRYTYFAVHATSVSYFTSVVKGGSYSNSFAHIAPFLANPEDYRALSMINCQFNGQVARVDCINQ